MILRFRENRSDYSLMNTIRSALCLTTSREFNCKATQAINTFFVRLGDMFQTGVVFPRIQHTQLCDSKHPFLPSVARCAGINITRRSLTAFISKAKVPQTFYL